MRTRILLKSFDLAAPRFAAASSTLRRSGKPTERGHGGGHSASDGKMLRVVHVEGFDRSRHEQPAIINSTIEKSTISVSDLKFAASLPATSSNPWSDT
jgi:hypothetical protein